MRTATIRRRGHFSGRPVRAGRGNGSGTSHSASLRWVGNSAGSQDEAGCEIIPYAEAPSELLAAFATRMRVGSWARFHTDKANAVYLSPRTDVMIGLEQERGLARMVTVLVTDITCADYTRLQTAANFLFARMVNVPEVTTRGEIDDALDKALRSGREAGAERGGVLLVAKPAQDNGLVVRIGRRRCP